MSRASSLSLILSTLSGTTNFCRVTDTTLATPELWLVGRITLPVLPSKSKSSDRETESVDYHVIAWRIVFDS